jgi:hypothetical protein
MPVNLTNDDVQTYPIRTRRKDIHALFLEEIGTFAEKGRVMEIEFDGDGADNNRWKLLLLWVWSITGEATFTAPPNNKIHSCSST